eukprot:COSAG03_NODE_11098_length_611_cov_1.023438_1_plen_57_part_10
MTYRVVRSGLATVGRGKVATIHHHASAYSSEEEASDRQTYRQTDRQTDRLLPLTAIL